MICGSQDSIQSDHLLASSSITDQQHNIPDLDGGQRSIDQHGAVRVRQFAGMNLFLHTKYLVMPIAFIDFINTYPVTNIILVISDGDVSF